jgi:hypothetical protein
MEKDEKSLQFRIVNKPRSASTESAGTNGTRDTIKLCDCPRED